MIIAGTQELVDHMTAKYPKRIAADNTRYAQQQFVIRSKVFKKYTFSKDIHGVSLDIPGRLTKLFRAFWST